MTTRKTLLIGLATAAIGLGAITGCNSDQEATRADESTPNEAEMTVDFDMPDVKTASIVVHPTIGTMCAIKAPDAHFEFDSAKLDKEEKSTARELARCLNTGKLQGQNVKLLGRADPRGPESYNKDLGMERAQAFADALMKHGVDRSRLKVESRGEKGFDEKGTKLKYAAQRRVDVQLFNPKPVELSIVYWDYNEDGRIAQDEFYTYVSGMYDFTAWDTNSDEWLSAEELATGYYLVWDSDMDGVITAEEYRRGSLTWYGAEDTYGAFDVWDIDKDKGITKIEWITSFNGTTIYADSDVDANGRLYEDEFSNYVYRFWDVDKNNSIDVNEIGGYYSALD